MLLVDRASNASTLIADHLRAAGADVVVVGTLHDALVALAAHRPDLVITELRLNGGLEYDGYILAEHASGLKIRCAVVSSWVCSAARTLAVSRGAIAIIEKPAPPSAIIAVAAGEPISAAPPRQQLLSADRAEWEHWHNTYFACGRNLTRTADVLDRDRGTVRKRLLSPSPPLQLEPDETTSR